MLILINVCKFLHIEVRQFLVPNKCAIFIKSYITSYSCFYCGEYHSCRDNKQKVADDDEDDTCSFVLLFPLQENI